LSIFDGSNNERQNAMKIQTRPLNQSGSFVNNLMGNNATEPVVGQPATLCLYSDRNPYEVISIGNGGKSCILRRLSAKRVDNNGMSECQSYEYTSNENAPTIELVWRKNGDGGVWKKRTQYVRFTDALLDRADLNKGDVRGCMTDEELIAVFGPTLRGEMQCVDGLTKIVNNYTPVSVMFGVAEKYYDFSY